MIGNILPSVSAKSRGLFLLGFVRAEIPLQESTWHRAHWSVPTHFKISQSSCITCFESAIGFGFNKDLSVISHAGGCHLTRPAPLSIPNVRRLFPMGCCITCLEKCDWLWFQDLSVISHVAVILGDPPRCQSQMLDSFLLLVVLYHDMLINIPEFLIR